jgi:hypothetical protein
MKILPQAKTLKNTGLVEMISVSAFTALSVYIPVLIHYFTGIDGGRTFLPMPFFVLLAGFFLGWRAGLATAIASPFINYLISGMPVANLLPFILVQLVVFGTVAGLMKEKFNALISIVAAVAAGWLAIGIFLALFSKVNAIVYVSQGIKIGWPGIALQIIFLPAIVFFVKKYSNNGK